LWAGLFLQGFRSYEAGSPTANVLRLVADDTAALWFMVSYDLQLWMRIGAIKVADNVQR
jgi:hypothetical protein